MAQSALTFALRQDRIVSVDSVPLGADCGCICPNPACAEPLIAKNRDFAGRKQQKYFAHRSGTQCDHATESALHRLAKQIIGDERRAGLPPAFLFDGSPCSHWRTFRHAEIARFDRVDIERSVDELRPDLLAWRGSDLTMIEIHVTHAVDEAKTKAAVARGWVMLEIDVSPFHGADFAVEDLRTFLCDAWSGRKWIFHGEATALRHRLEDVSSLRISLQDACPLGLGLVPEITPGPHGSPVWHHGLRTSPCDRCEFCLQPYTPHGGAVVCSGQPRVGSIGDLARHERGESPVDPAWLRDALRARAVSLREHELTLRRTRVDTLRLRLAGLVRGSLNVNARRVAKLRGRLHATLSTNRDRELNEPPDKWLIPIMEWQGDTPRPCALSAQRLARLRPVTMMRPVAPALNRSLETRTAANLGLYWHSELRVWCYISIGGVTIGPGGQLITDTVPPSVRRFLDPSARWRAIHPTERAQLRGAQVPDTSLF